jgi:hypothetical protein
MLDRGGVRECLVKLPKLPRLAPPLIAGDNVLKVASLLHLAATGAGTSKPRI